MRYFDYVINTEWGKEIFSTHPPEAIFKVDNVCRYLYEQTDQESWNMTEDFPNLAPPFPTYWMETSAPRFVNSEIHGRINWNAWARLGVAFEAHEVNSPAFLIPDLGSGRAIEYRDRYNRNIKWSVRAMVFMDWDFVRTNKDFVCDFIGQIVYGVLDDGTVSQDKGNDALICETAPPPFIGHTRGLIDATLLATSFIHCKNVTLIENIPPNKINEHHKRKCDRDLTKYYTLHINPLRKILRHEGAEKHSGVSHALHICRGHFKDFRQSGLFGKYPGVFWWDNQVRGSRERGIIHKDYAVRGPNAN